MKAFQAALLLLARRLLLASRFLGCLLLNLALCYFLFGFLLSLLLGYFLFSLFLCCLFLGWLFLGLAGSRFLLRLALGYFLFRRGL